MQLVSEGKPIARRIFVVVALLDLRREVYHREHRVHRGSQPQSCNAPGQALDVEVDQ